MQNLDRINRALGKAATVSNESDGGYLAVEIRRLPTIFNVRARRKSDGALMAWTRIKTWEFSHTLLCPE